MMGYLGAAAGVPPGACVCSWHHHVAAESGGILKQGEGAPSMGLPPEALALSACVSRRGLRAKTSGGGASSSASTVTSDSTTMITATGHQAPLASATAQVASSGSGPPTSAPVVSRASAMR